MTNKTKNNYKIKIYKAKTQLLEETNDLFEDGWSDVANRLFDSDSPPPPVSDLFLRDTNFAITFNHKIMICWFIEDNYGGTRVRFIDVFEAVPSAIKEKLSYHMDIFLERDFVW